METAKKALKRVALFIGCALCILFGFGLLLVLDELLASWFPWMIP